MLKKIKQSVLAKNTFIYMFSSIVNKIVPFLLIPILTIYLSPSDYGVVSTFGAFTAISAIFIRLSTTSSVNVNFFKIPRKDLNVYIANVIIIVINASVIFYTIVYLFQDELSITLEIPREWICIGVFLALMRFFTSINLVLWQAEQKPKAFAVYEIALMLVVTGLTLFFVVLFKLGWVGVLAAQVIGAFLFSLISIYFIYKRKYVQFKVSKKYMLEALKFGLPLLPHAVSSWFRTGADRIFLTTLIGTSATGLYSIGYQFGFIVGIVATAFNQAFSPYLFKKLKSISQKDKIKLVKWTYVYFLALLFLAILVSFMMPLVIEYFLDDRYLKSSSFISWIAFGFAFQGMWIMIANYVYYTKKTYGLSLVSIIAGVLHVILSYTMIKSNGAIGAAQASTLSFFVSFVLVWILSAKVYQMPWNLKE